MRRCITAVLFFAAVAALAGESPRMSYIYSRGSRPHIISASSFDIVSIRKLQRRYGNDFLWTRVDGRDYVIRDAATLDGVRQLFAPLDAISPDYEALERRIRPLERGEDEIEERMEESEDDDDDALQREHRDLQRQLRALEAEESRLDRRQEELEQVAERQLELLIDRAIARGIAVAI